MSYNYRLICEYDGTFYHGWQKQPCKPTLQGTLEAAIAAITSETPSLTGAGRTDAGVHALGQTAHFHLTKNWDTQTLLRGLNAVLPMDIAVTRMDRVADSFHARYDAVWKTYRYSIYNSPIRSPCVRQTAWFLHRPLDLPRMRRAALHFVGTHDFTSLTAAEHDAKRCTAEIEQIRITKKEALITVTLTASRFLRYMVRNIVGVLVEVGYGRRQASEIPDILDAKDRRRAGRTAPPHGLCLVQVEYKSSSLVR